MKYRFKDAVGRNFEVDHEVGSALRAWSDARRWLVKNPHPGLDEIRKREPVRMGLRRIDT